MAHMTKHSKGSVGNILRENERDLTDYKNSVDPQRTHLNYNLNEGDSYECYKNILKDVHVMNRKNVNTCCTWVVTYPLDLIERDEDDNIINPEELPEKTRKFFEESYKFLTERYGIENCISSIVHNDETTPHMHFNFVPVTELSDKQKQNSKYKEKRGRVNAHEVVSRNDLRSFHNDLDDHMYEVFKIDKMCTTGNTERSSMSIEELKELDKREESISNQMTALNDTVRDINKGNNALKLKEDELKAFESSLNERNTRLNARETTLNKKEYELTQDRKKFHTEHLNAYISDNTRELTIENNLRELFSDVVTNDNRNDLIANPIDYVCKYALNGQEGLYKKALFKNRFANALYEQEALDKQLQQGTQPQTKPQTQKKLDNLLAYDEELKEKYKREHMDDSLDYS